MSTGSAASTSRIVTPRGGIRATQVGGNTVGAVLRERAPRADGYRHLDTPAMIARLQEMRANTYVYGVWDTPVDWPDLCDEFAPAAEAAGIDIWIYLVPPTETDLNGRASRPYLMDYVAWARACAELSVKHANVRAWGIDDFEFDQNAELFTSDYMAEMRRTAEEISPQLGFYTCAYYGAATSDAFLDKYSPYIDGILYPFLDGENMNTQVAGTVAADLDAILEHTEPRGLDLVLLVYTGRFLDAPLEPTAEYCAESVRVGLEYARAGRIAGVTAYGLQLDDAPTVACSNRAMYGVGRLSLSMPNRVVVAGAYAEASQVVSVDPDAPRHELSFWHYEDFASRIADYGCNEVQVLVDDEVVWRQDVRSNPHPLWMQGSGLQGPIDLTSSMRGKTSARLALRLAVLKDNRSNLDVGFDHLEPQGFLVRDPGFESGAVRSGAEPAGTAGTGWTGWTGWTLTQSHGLPLAAIDLWVPDRARRNFDAVAAEYAASAEALT